MRARALVLASVGAALPLIIVNACGNDNAEVVGGTGQGAQAANGGSGGSGGTGGTGGSGGGGLVGGGGSGGTGAAATGGSLPGPEGCAGAPPCYPAVCQNKVYECANCIDDDIDTWIDMCDIECTGPCDDSEDSLHPLIPGGGEAPCKLDCYFDGDSGSGNDECVWDHRCDPLCPQCEDPKCQYDPDDPSAQCPAEQSPECLDFCLPLVPNGCDCFGCCELPAESGKFVFIGSEDASDNPTCTMEVVEDPDLCHPCTPVMDCFNDCGHCELCMGKTTLPPDCFDPDGGTPDQCPPGVQPCGLPGQDPCPPGWYCITGCCVEPPG